MPVSDLVSYIRQQSQAGVSAQELRETLMSSGWSEMDIENALHDVAAGLQPMTSGASIHEDLAQVRSLVAHLTARVGKLEARLTSSPMLTEPDALPSGALQPERALPGPRSRRVVVVWTVIAVVVCVAFGSLLSGITEQNASGTLNMAGGLALFFALFAWFFVRAKRVWPARFCAAIAVAIGAWSAWLGWEVFSVIKGTTALGVGVLLAVYLFVIARWIARLDR